MIMTVFKQELGKGNSISCFKSPKSCLTDAHVFLSSMFSWNRKAQTPALHREHLLLSCSFSSPLCLAGFSQCPKQKMKLTALFLLPQLNFVLFSVSILVGGRTDKLLGSLELGNLGTRLFRRIHSSPVNELLVSLSELFCCCYSCHCFKIILRSYSCPIIDHRTTCMVVEFRIVFWE